MYTLDPGREHEDLEGGFGLGQFGDPLRIQFEGKEFARRALGVEDIEVGSKRRANQLEDRPEDAICIETDHVVDERTEFGAQFLRTLLGLAIGIELSLEEPDEQPGGMRMRE